MKNKARKIRKAEELIPNFSNLPIQVKNSLDYSVRVVQQYHNKFLSLYHIIDGIVYGNLQITDDIQFGNVGEIVNGWKKKNLTQFHFFAESPKKKLTRKFFITDSTEKFLKMIIKYDLQTVEEMYLALSFGIKTNKLYENPYRMGYSFSPLNQYNLTAMEYCNKGKGWDLTSFQNNLMAYREVMECYSKPSKFLDTQNIKEENA